MDLRSVQKQTISYTTEEINIIRPTLLTMEQVEHLLNLEERQYKKHWWLKTSGSFYKNECYVKNNGDLCYNGRCDSNYDYWPNNGYDNRNKYSIRPALEIEIIDDNLSIGDIFKFGKYEFKIISLKLAWMYRQDIGDSVFGDTNDYGKSKVRHILWDWFCSEFIENIE